MGGEADLDLVNRERRLDDRVVVRVIVPVGQLEEVWREEPSAVRIRGGTQVRYRVGSWRGC